MESLRESKVNREYSIVKIDILGDRKRHLEDLGFTEGSFIEVLSNNAGDVILYLKETRLAITRNVSKDIYIKEIEEG